MKRDFYEVLGCARGASIEEIKLAYRKLAKEIHPDRNPGDASCEQRFKEVNEAYDILKDEQRRAAYDRYGHAAFENGGGQRANGFDFASSFTDVFDDLFGEFMGTRRPRRQNRGSDLRYNLEIALEDAFRGTEAHIKVQSAVNCETCSGIGAEPGSKPEPCTMCSGAGKVRSQQGFFTIERTCPNCRGLGRFIRNPCKTCHGSGQVQKDRTLAVNVPAGVEEGTRIRLTGEGQAGLNGGPPGDLYIFLSIKPHPIFQRDGNNLYCRAPISFAAAALGGGIDVPTCDGGRSRVTIPEGTQSGKQFRLRGKGMPVLRGGGMAGDMFVEVVVETPKKLTKKQKELLRAFEKENEEGTHPEAEGFFTRVKEFWARMGVE